MKKTFFYIAIILLSKNVLAQAGNGIPDFGFKAYNTGQAFTSVTVDENDNIWAGTDKQGLFFLDQATGSDVLSITNFTDSNVGEVSIKSLASDALGNVWVGHAGVNYTNGAGGLGRFNINSMVYQHYSPDRNALGFSFMERDGNGTLYVKDVDVDINGTVWLAQWRHHLTSGSTFILTPGAISYKFSNEEKFTTQNTWQDVLDNTATPELPYPAYTYNPDISQTPQSRNINTISSDSSEVWAAVFPYTTKDTEEFLPSRILTYDLQGTFIKQYTQEDIGFETRGVFNAIYRNNNKGTWASVSLSNTGFAVYNDGEWSHLNPEVDSIQKIIPPDTRINDNAIWGNEFGNVFIGTNNGIIVYDGHGPVDHISSYMLYSKTELIDPVFKPQMIVDESMISNNILAGASDGGGNQWIATDNGVMKGVFGGYRNPETNTWIMPSPSGDGIMVYQGTTWQYLSPSIDSIQKIIPPETEFNSAVWGNSYGNIFIGSNNGLLIYDGRNPIDHVSSYTFHSNEVLMPESPYQVLDERMTSNNILAGRSVNDTIQRILTDDGTYDLKVGLIPTFPHVGICPQSWKQKTDFMNEDAPEQCLLSVNQSTNTSITQVESSIANKEDEDSTYHLYQIYTKIGHPKDENGHVYTVEQVFELMKKYAAFQAITPLDFPEEVLGDNFLKAVTPEQIQRFSELVNEQTERISTIQDIMDLDNELNEYDIQENSFKASVGFHYSQPNPPTPPITMNYSHPETLSSVEEFYQQQLASNPVQSIHEEQEYHLYNTPAAARTRRTFSSFYEGVVFGLGAIKTSENCEGDGLKDIRYDPVIMHIDDNNYTITNYTLEGHYFHPGKIVRTVVRDDETGDIYIRTIGEGLHFCKGELGAFSANLNTLMGLILFKNVDLRLRDTLEENPEIINN